MMLLTGQSGPDFMIHGIFRFSLFGQEVWLTTTTVSLLLVSLMVLGLGLLANRTLKNAKDEPSGFQNALELAYEMLENMTEGVLGQYAPRFRNYIGTLFIFILFSNLCGLLGLRNPTADFGITFALGMITFGIVQYQGVKNRRFRHLTSLFEPTPVLFPINLIGELANPLSISLRLFANVLSGVIITGLWYGMVHMVFQIGLPSFLHAYTDVFSGAIQTYVFCMLSMVYINDKME